VEAVGRLPAADRHVLAVLGSGLLLRPPPGSRDYLRRAATFTAWLEGIRRGHIDSDA
jgi:hypothetical protein